MAVNLLSLWSAESVGNFAGNLFQVASGGARTITESQGQVARERSAQIKTKESLAYFGCSMIDMPVVWSLKLRRSYYLGNGFVFDWGPRISFGWHFESF